MKDITNFLSYDIFDVIRNKKIQQIIDEQEYYLKSNACSSANATKYLTSIYHLGSTYCKANQINKIKSLLIHLSSLFNVIPEYKEEIDVIWNYLRYRYSYNLCESVNIENHLQVCIEYAVKYNKTEFLGHIVNASANLFSKLGHRELSILFYVISIDLFYQSRKLSSNISYTENVLYPISNLITKIEDQTKRAEIEKAIFYNENFDISTRYYLGDMYSYECYNQGIEFDKDLFEKICKTIYGNIESKNHYDCIWEIYSSSETPNDDIEKYYEKEKDSFTEFEHLYYNLISNNDDKYSEIIKHLNNPVFDKNAEFINSIIDDFSDSDKEKIALFFIDFLRNTKRELSYNSYNEYIAYFKNNETVFDKNSIGLLMLKQSTSDYCYYLAKEIADLIHTKYAFSEPVTLIKDTIESLIIKDGSLKCDLIDNLSLLVENNSNYFHKYDKLIDNLNTCRTILTGSNLYTLDKILLSIETTRKRRGFMKEMSEIGNDESSYDAELGESIIKLFDGFKKDGVIISLFRLINKIDNEKLLRIPKLDVPQDIPQTNEDKSQIEINITPLIKDNEYYIQLKNLLQDKKWTIDEKDLNINYIHVYRGKIHHLLYLFHDNVDAWLADEEKFNDEDPLWFSESSHQVSPVFKLRNYIQLNSIDYLGDNLPIVVMMPPTYVINADEMMPPTCTINTNERINADVVMNADEKMNPWKNIIVVKFEEVRYCLNKYENLPQVINYRWLSDKRSFKNPKEIAELKSKFINVDIKEELEKTKKEKTEAQEKEFNSPFNFSQIYEEYKDKPYYADTDNFSQNKELKYNIYNCYLHEIAKNFLAQIREYYNLKKVTIELYQKDVDVKWRIVVLNDNITKITEFTIDNYSSDDLIFVEKVLHKELWVENKFIYIARNMASGSCCTLLYFEDEYDSFCDENEEGIQDIKECFRFAHNSGDDDKLKNGLIGVHLSILKDKNHSLAEKAAKTAIMSRNMSHNLGSHVMAYLKRDLSSVQTIFQKELLKDLYPLELPNNIEDFNLTDLKSTINKIKENNKNTEMPFLVGVGRFISYLQERQDFIATVATDYIPYFSPINFKDDIYDTLNPDYRYLRHSDRRGYRPENLLLKYIALSEGLSRDSKCLDKHRKNDIVICFRKFDGINDYRRQNERLIGKPDGPGRFDLEDMRQYSFYLPGGIVGRQALFSILENIIRNSAKHGNWRSKGKLELVFDIQRGRNLCESEELKDLRDYLYDKPKWKIILDDFQEKLNDYFIFTITDNLDINDSDFQSLEKSLSEEYVDDNAKMIDNHKGIKEIRISASWIRGISNDLKIPYNEPPVVTVRKVQNTSNPSIGSLQYIFCIMAPKKVLFISDNKDERERIQKNISIWDGWYVIDIDEYKSSQNKAYDIIVLNNDNLFKELRPISSDRLVLSNRVFDLVQNTECDQEILLDILYRESYHIKDNDEKLLIIDGKTEKPISQNIVLVKSDSDISDVDGYKYAYRTHHQYSQEFNAYMDGELSKHLLAIEGITGNNSTDRLIRNEKLDSIWYYKHLSALRTKVAIFDERLFSKVTELEDTDLYNADTQNGAIASFETSVNVQRNIWFFNVLYNNDKQCFDVWGYDPNDGTLRYDDGNYKSRIVKVAEIVSTSFEWDNLGRIPSIIVNVFFKEYQNFAYYLSIHQGLMDKIYNAFGVKRNDTYDESIRNNNAILQRAKRIAMCSISSELFKSFHQQEDKEYSEFEELLDKFLEYDDAFCKYRPGFFIHSGRSKPSIFDMPQKLPFIQYAAIENAVYDCKYTLVELLKSAKYE